MQRRKPTIWPLIFVVLAALGCSALDKARREIAEAGKPKTLTSSNGKYQISIPGDWSETSKLNEQATIQAAKLADELYVVVITEDKTDFADDMTLEKYTGIIIEQMKGRVTDAEASEPVSLTVNGNNATRFELKGTISSLKAVYVCTIVETKGSFNQVLGWTLNSRFKENKPKLVSVEESFSEVSGDLQSPPPPKPKE